MPKNYYDHNVDVRSSQIGNAAKDAKKFFKGAFGGVVGLFMLLGIAGGVIAIFSEIDGNIRAPKAPRLNIYQATKDYFDQELRYSRNFDGKYFSYQGTVSSIGSESFDINGPYVQTSQGQMITEVNCWLSLFQGEKAERLDIGGNVLVAGQLYSENYDRYGKSIKFELRSCKIL